MKRTKLKIMWVKLSAIKMYELKLIITLKYRHKNSIFRISLFLS